MTVRGPQQRVIIAEGAIDLSAREVVVSGQVRSLTPIEAALLGFLVQRSGDPVPREVLLREVWGYNPNVVSRTLDTTVARLRSKIERDPARPRHLLTAPGVGYRFVPHASATPAPTSPEPLIGREGDLEALRRALARRPPVLTLTGPAGVGKSHLLRALAAELGTVVVDLGAVDRVASVPDAVTGALDRVAAPGWPGLGRLLAHREPPLLALDGLDHLGPGLGEALDELSRAAADSGKHPTLLVASRAALRCAGERVVELGPLGSSHAVQLYRSLARALDPADEPALAELVERLGRVPLAVALAAARSSVLCPREQLARLDHALDLLVDPRGEGISLRGSIAGSWALLDVGDREALRALCVLRAPFGLDVAEAVLGLPPSAALDAVQRLRERSLLCAEQGRDGSRFYILNPIKWFVVEQIAEAPAAEERHARLFARWTGPTVLAVWELDGGDGGARRRLVAERADLEAATQWALRARDADLAARAWLGFFEASRLGGDGDLLAGTARRILDTPGLSEELRADVMPRLGDLLRRTGRVADGLGLAREAVERARRREDPLRLAYALHALGCFAQDLGDQTEAERLCSEAIVLARAHGARAIEAAALAIRGNAALARGAPDDARDDMLGAVDLFRAMGNRRLEAVTLGALGNVFHERGLAEPALEAWAAALLIQRELGDRRGEALVLGNRALLLAHKGQAATAEADLRRALVLHEETRQRRFRAVVLGTLADVLRLQGRPVEATSVAREAIRVGHEAGWRAAALVGESILGELEVSLGEPERGLRRLSEAEATLRELGLAGEAAIAACRRARGLIKAGEREAAAELLEPLRAEAARDTELGVATREALLALERAG